MSFRSKVRRGASLCVLVGVAGLGGCSDDGGGFTGVASGRLGYANFSWGCAGSGDLACELSSAFPRAVALGSTYELRYSIADEVPNEVQAGPIELAGAQLAAVYGDNRFHAGELGEVTLMAVSREDQVIDFTSIQQVEIDDLRLRSQETEAFPEQCDPEDPCEAVAIEFMPGRSQMVRIEPLGVDGEPLVGDLDYEWHVSPSAVARLSSSRGNEATISVESGGLIEIEVVVEGSLSRTFHFRTASEGPRRTPPESDDTGTGSDSGGTEGSQTGEDSGTQTGDDSGTGTDDGGSTGATTTGGER